MTECELYAMFRTEIETMYAPLVLKECDEVIKIIYDNEEVGLLCVKDKYIQGLYILPKHRRKGYGRKAILDYIKKYGMLKDLTILNTNDNAKAFWNSLFELEAIKTNSIDTYYKIKELKPQFTHRKPDARQKSIIRKLKLNPEEWDVVSEKITLIHKETKAMRIFDEKGNMYFTKEDAEKCSIYRREKD